MSDGKFLKRSFGCVRRFFYIRFSFLLILLVKMYWKVKFVQFMVFEQLIVNGDLKIVQLYVMRVSSIGMEVLMVIVEQCSVFFLFFWRSQRMQMVSVMYVMMLVYLISIDVLSERFEMIFFFQFLFLRLRQQRLRLMSMRVMLMKLDM